MPELPDIVVYLERSSAGSLGELLEGVRVHGPVLLRTVAPPLAELQGRRVGGVRRVGKRIVFELEGELFLVLHLMIAGRLRWRAGPGARRRRAARRRRKRELGALDFRPAPSS